MVLHQIFFFFFFNIAFTTYCNNLILAFLADEVPLKFFEKDVSRVICDEVEEEVDSDLLLLEILSVFGLLELTVSEKLFRQYIFLDLLVRVKSFQE